MPKGRKPAIDGLARPAGLADDIAKATAGLASATAKKVTRQLVRSNVKRKEMAKTAKMAKRHMDLMKKYGQNWGGGR